MHSATKWKSRLLAAAVAIATVVASLVGAYAHTACHHPFGAHPGVSRNLGASTVATAPNGGTDVAGMRVVALGDKQVLALSDSGQDDHDPTRHAEHHCGMCCYGGPGILGAAPFVAGAFNSTPPIVAAAAMRGLSFGGLERPPKPFRTL